MVNVEFVENNKEYNIPSDFLKGKRHLTKDEISVLKANQNYNEDESWDNFYVDDSEDGFDASLIVANYFSGYIVLGKLRPVMLKYHDLSLKAGIRNSKLKDIITGDDFVIYKVDYFENYRIGNRVVLYDIKEVCCTNHSKFGVGLAAKGASDDSRMWIGVANENNGRQILPFESMFAADAYLWSHYRVDAELL